MRITHSRRWVGMLVVIGALVVISAEGQGASRNTPEQLDAMKARLDHFKSFAERLPAQKRRALSSGAQNLMHLAEQWERVTALLDQTPRQGATDTRAATSLEPGQVSDPSQDVRFSSFAGFTQSETSTAWCGSNIVIGFNDSGSQFEHLLVSPNGSFNFNGVARSTDTGGSFADLGFLPSDPLPPGTVAYDLGGDPVVRCTDADTFYYASLGTNLTRTLVDRVIVEKLFSEIAVSKSRNGGASFDGPVTAARKRFSTHFLDKPWMAVDPTDPNRLYVTYTDFDFSFTSAACGDQERTAIELVRSVDGGQTWRKPVVIAEVCGFRFVQGSQVVVGPDGEVYVAWEAFGRDFLTRQINIRKSTDAGKTFGPRVKVDDVSCVGDCFLFQGAFRTAFEFPSLAVDRSGQETHGDVYIAWHDSRKLQAGDSFIGFYGFADVLVSRSRNGGATWSVPVQVNDTAEPAPSGLGTDQYQPGIAVDHRGMIGVCFYDRRRDASNFLIDRFCATSDDAGKTWLNMRKTQENFAPVPAQDFLIDVFYMGDYDELASDFTQGERGFIGGYGSNARGNPDVQAHQLAVRKEIRP